MSFVTDSIFLNKYRLTRLNSQFAVQNANQGLLNMLGNSQELNPAEALKREKQFMFTSLNNQLLATYYAKAEEALEKQQKENIKRSFSTFA